MLIFGGDVLSGTTINANNYTVVVTGNNNGTINSTLTLSGSSTLDFDSSTTEFNDFSNYLSNLNANSLLDYPNGTQHGEAKFNADSSVGIGLVVFNIDASELFGNNLVQQYNLVLNNQSPSAVVINVAGEVISDATMGNPVGGFNESNSDFMIWNFYQVLEINLNIQLHGSLLAPLATLSTSNNIDGSVIENDFEQNGEAHNNLFTGTITYDPISVVTAPTQPTAVPVPSSLLIFAAALFGFGVWRRRSA